MKVIVSLLLVLGLLYPTESTALLAQDDSIGVGNSIVDGNYIGGLYKALPTNYTVYKTASKQGITVSSVEQLLKALKEGKSGTIIYLDGDVNFDMTGCQSVVIPRGVTISSDRGINKSKGALVFTNSLNTRPLFVTGGENVRISGIRFRGPDSLIINKAELQKAAALAQKKTQSKKTMSKKFNIYGIPNSQGILIKDKKTEIENCELSGWSYSAIGIDNGGEANIHHNYIHHNQRTGLGYGVSLMSSGYALIKANVFDYNRHAIASTGAPGTGYTACYNISLNHSTLQAHIFDVHGGKDRKDGSDIAGDSVSIYNNLFYLPEGKIAFRIRGVPRYNSKIFNNEIIVSQGKAKVSALRSMNSLKSSNSKVDNYIDQVFGNGNVRIYNNRISNK